MSTQNKEKDYEKEHADTMAAFENAMDKYVNGTDELTALETQAQDYAKSAQEYINKYTNRDKFSYDVNTDAMYAMYRNQYEKNAKSAQREAQSAAAGLTGGYGSTYASAMGNRAYSNEMDKLNDKASELYENAYARYVQDGQDLLDKASLFGSQADALRARINDKKNGYLSEAEAAEIYANHLYQKTPEYAAAQEEATNNANRESLEALLNSEGDIKSTTYKMQRSGDHTGYGGIANAIDLERDLLDNIQEYDNASDFWDELYTRLKTVTVGSSRLTPGQITAYMSWVFDSYEDDLPSEWFDKNGNLVIEEVTK